MTVGEPGQCNWPSPNGKWRCPLEPGHYGVCENYHAAWYRGVWFPISKDSDWAAIFDPSPGALWAAV